MLRDMEDYYAKLDALGADLAKYDAILLVGGSGPIVDIANNDRIHALIMSFLKEGKPIGAECYGVTALAFARDLSDRKSIIWGKHVTGHCKEYDYKDGTGFMGTDFNMGPPPYPLAEGAQDHLVALAIDTPRVLFAIAVLYVLSGPIMTLSTTAELPSRTRLLSHQTAALRMLQPASAPDSR